MFEKIYMQKNVGGFDRGVRAVLGVVFAYLSYTAMSTTWMWVFGVLAVVMLGTALVGFCYLYTLLGIGTCACAADSKGGCCGSGKCCQAKK